VFFNSSFDRKSSRKFPQSRRFSRGAALALAVAAAAPVVALSSRAAAMNEMDQALVLLAEQAKTGDAELLAKGMDQCDKGQFEDAQATLVQVKADGLSAGEKAKLAEAMKKVEGALSARKAARAEFELGEQALSANDVEGAIKHYRNAVESKYADPATREKAAGQLASAEATQKDAKQSLKRLYDDAVADAKAGRLPEAKEKFAHLNEAGFKAGLFQKKPTQWLAEIDKKLGVASAPAVAEKTEPKTTEPKVTEAKAPEKQPEATQVKAPPTTAPAVAQAAKESEPAKATGKDEYEAGREAYKQGDYAAARAHFQASQSAGYKPGLFQGDSPARYLAMIDAKEKTAEEAAQAAKATTAPTTAPSVAAVSPAQRDLMETARLEKAKREQLAFEAQQFVERAKKAQSDNRMADALALYGQAASLDPENKEAVDGKNRLQLLTTGGNEKSMLQREDEKRAIQRQITGYSFDKSIADAESAVGRKEFAVAQEAIDRAVVARESHPEIFNREELKAFDTRVSQTKLALKTSEESEKRNQQTVAQDQAARDAIERQRQEQEELRRTVSQLARESRQLVREGNYVTAEGTINHILAIDPTNEYATGVKQLVHDAAVLQGQRRNMERKDRELEKNFNATEERKIPYSDLQVFPDNWPDISGRRDKLVAEERGGTSDNAQVEALLAKKLPEVRFDQAGFADAIEFLRDVSGANIFVEWKTLETAGIERTVPVTARLRDIKFSKALSTILADVGGATTPLSYTIDDGVITISTTDALNKNVVIETYDIRDLLVIPPDPNNMGGGMMGGMGMMGGGMGGMGGGMGGMGGGMGGMGGGMGGMGGGMGGMGGGMGGMGGMGMGGMGGMGMGGMGGGMGMGGMGGGMGGMGGGMGGGGNNTQQDEQDLVDDITQLIIDTVDTNSWIDNGGPGSIQFLSGQLIVTQTPDNQKKLLGLLDKLRAASAIQVSIETRFLTVRRNFLNDIGVDLDFFFNINDPNRWSPIQVSQNHSAFPSNPSTGVPGSIDKSGQQPAMQIQGSFLDDFQANFLIRATQSSKYSTLVNAPRITVFNAQTAYVSVTQQKWYVGALVPVIGDGVGLFNPIPMPANTGVTLRVRPTVSADRKYVTLVLEPTLMALVEMTSFPVFGLANNNNNNGNNGGGGNNGQPNIFTANIQQPVQDITTLQTIVSVPDGGTLLLGGQTVAGEVEVEEGVPILSKIPIIKRAFTNKSTAKDENILLILVKPTIIMHREYEQQQFPLLGSKASK
jgi:general secretion pathway protein D